MTKVKINGYGNQSSEVFEVLEKNVLQKQLSAIDRQLLATQLLEYTDMKQVSGMAYIYLDARDGRLKDEWLDQGESLHPWDSFYHIILMDEVTPIDWENVTDYDFIDEYSPEWNEFQEWYDEKGCGTAEEFILDKYGEDELEERKQIIFEHWAENMEFRDDIDEQIEKLYGDQDPHDEIINNIENIVAELDRGNDVTIKKGREGIRILSYKPKKINK